MLRSHARQIHILLLSADLCLAGGAVLALAALWPVEPAAAKPLSLLAFGLGASLVWLPVLHQLALYGSQRRQDFLSLLGRIAAAGVIGTGLIAALAWVLGWPSPLSGALALGTAQIALLGGMRIAGWGGLRLLRRRGRNYRSLIILGSGSRAREVRDEIEAHPEWGFRILGFLDDRDVPVDPAIPAERVHKFQDLPVILSEQVVDEAIVACPRSMLADIAPAVGLLAEVGIPVTLLSDLFGDLVPAPRATRFGSMTALSFAPVHHGRVQLVVKRSMDVVGGACLLALSAPLIGVAALLVKATSRGPVFFRQVRCGLRGRPFVMLKLRTMYVDAEERRWEFEAMNEMDGPVFKIKHDPRVIPAVRWLRRFSVDETPQFWNVLRGDMSLVGPRPPLPEEVAQYRPRDRRRLSMRPGLTCLWQVSGRNRVGFEDWMGLDLSYIDSWSLGVDARILLKTPRAVMRGDGAS
jgi:exopolysaccharide biosynthesis polyprenyl glycosylphosphotransferase